MPVFKDRTNDVYGNLTVQGRYLKVSPVLWVCKCTCGNQVTVKAGNLASGNTKSCGCSWGLSKVTHGHTRYGVKDGTYRSWADMKARCVNEHSPAYEHYGARGIKVCLRWLDFNNFLLDMGERKCNETLERIDVDGDYEPTNCCWITKQRQGYNKRNSRLLTYNGETKCLAEWALIKGEYIRCRIKNGWTIQEAIEIPKGRRRLASF